MAQPWNPGIQFMTISKPQTGSGFRSFTQSQVAQVFSTAVKSRLRNWPLNLIGSRLADVYAGSIRWLPSSPIIFLVSINIVDSPKTSQSQSFQDLFHASQPISKPGQEAVVSSLYMLLTRELIEKLHRLSNILF
jgi:hypothetical protein